MDQIFFLNFFKRPSVSVGKFQVLFESFLMLNCLETSIPQIKRAAVKSINAFREKKHELNCFIRFFIGAFCGLRRETSASAPYIKLQIALFLTRTWLVSAVVTSAKC